MILLLFIVSPYVVFNRCFLFHNLEYRLSMKEVLQKVIRLISRTDFSSRNTVQFFFLDIRVGWCAKKEWRMRRKKSRFLSTMTRLDFDLSVFRLNSFLCRIGYSDFSFHFPRFFLSFFYPCSLFSFPL